ncbi:MAG TPA: hypothetical protein VNB29_06890 [Chthoniobacterales bacterium]|jgi:hypothetical protein|nr:hypothetical protein [Chthoniobacterales bacterium]
MIADPLHEIAVLLFLLVGYSLLGLTVWFIFCGTNTAAVRKLNRAVASRRGGVFSIQAAVERRHSTSCSTSPDLQATLIALVAEKRLSKKLAGRLARIAPVCHEGKWVVYPSNAYWSHQFERLKSR